MAAGHVTRAAVAPLIALENEMINMISTLHLAFQKLFTKSKTFVSLPDVVCCVTDLGMLTRSR